MFCGELVGEVEIFLSDIRSYVRNIREPKVLSIHLLHH